MCERLADPRRAAFWLLFMGVITVMFLICSIRTNVCFVIFTCLSINFFIQTGGSLLLAADHKANAHMAHTLEQVRASAVPSSSIPSPSFF